MSCRCHHEQRSIFYLFIIYVLQEVTVREVKNHLKYSARGCPLEHWEGVCPDPRTSALVWKNPAVPYETYKKKKKSLSCLLGSFPGTVSLMLNQFSVENKMEITQVCPTYFLVLFPKAYQNPTLLASHRNAGKSGGEGVLAEKTPFV